LIVDEAKPNLWLNNCIVAQQYLNFLKVQSIQLNVSLATNPRIRPLLGCKSQCNSSELIDFRFGSLDNIANFTSYLPINSTCFNTLQSILINGAQISYQIRMDLIKNIFYKVDPIFFQIFQMINGTDDLNFTQRVDPILFLNGLINQTVYQLAKYSEIESLASNLTVSYLSI
jgi:hypothetical protein